MSKDKVWLIVRGPRYQWIGKANSYEASMDAVRIMEHYKQEFPQFSDKLLSFTADPSISELQAVMYADRHVPDHWAKYADLAKDRE